MASQFPFGGSKIGYVRPGGARDEVPRRFDRPEADQPSTESSQALPLPQRGGVQDPRQVDQGPHMTPPDMQQMPRAKPTAMPYVPYTPPGHQPGHRVGTPEHLAQLQQGLQARLFNPEGAGSESEATKAQKQTKQRHDLRNKAGQFRPADSRASWTKKDHSIADQERVSNRAATTAGPILQTPKAIPTIQAQGFSGSVPRSLQEAESDRPSFQSAGAPFASAKQVWTWTIET